LYADPKPNQLHIFLHAFKYTVGFDLGLVSTENHPSSIVHDQETNATTIISDIPTWAGWDNVDIAHASQNWPTQNKIILE
jgi:hypothetical protein